MNITDIRACAGFYQKNYLETFYLVVTYYGKSFILIGEKSNFPHLMGIQQNTYRSNGYNSPKILFRDILQICMRNRNNLLLDAVNERYYLDIAASNRIHCRINGIQY